MWLIVLCIAVGIVIGLGGLFLFVWVANGVDAAQSRRRAVLEQGRHEAERRLQQITQEALQRMLEIARGRS